MTVLKFRKKPKKKRLHWRCLRTYEVNMAQRDHSCWNDNCYVPIYAGDGYRGEIWVAGKFFQVRKYHTQPPCDFYQDPDEDEKHREEHEDKKIP
jgi:hypothetical protein